MEKLVFILGGARSGKSNFALMLAKKLAKKVIYIATYERKAKDREMEERISEHRKVRPKNWQLIEEPLNLGPVIMKAEKSENFSLILIDCLSLWITNLLLRKKKNKAMLQEIENLLAVIKKTGKKFIIVSNEVGMGIVPSNKNARLFRDTLGKANQIIAASADEAYYLISGIPLKIKSPSILRFPPLQKGN